MANLIFLGAPGAGKGTQAEKVCEKYNIPAISTGNILREAVKNKTKAGVAAHKYMEKGDLVPDGIVIDILQDRIGASDAKHGFILDGFPRTVIQAQTLEKMGVAIDGVVEIDVPDTEIVKRMSGRRVCETCGASYHIEFNPAKVDGVCDKCGGVTAQRTDDVPETVMTRLSAYHSKTAPLSGFYAERGKLKKVSGVGGVSEITERVFVAVAEIENGVK